MIFLHVYFKLVSIKANNIYMTLEQPIDEAIYMTLAINIFNQILDYSNVLCINLIYFSKYLICQSLIKSKS